MSKNVRIIFIVNGEKREFLVPVGTTVLEAAHNNDIDLEGACEGSLACSTCHVVVDDKYYSKLKPASEDEEDMIDLAAGATRYSRLSCQIILDESLDGLTVRLPVERHNMQGR
jgi:2Fe-2S ferredoxin